MADNKIIEGVGKKIVEALKQQSDVEIQTVVENAVPPENTSVTFEEPEVEFTNNFEENFEPEIDTVEDEIPVETFAETPVPAMTQPDVKPQMFTPSTMTFNQPIKDNFANDLEGFEIPTNVAVLKQLINQLPTGVSKQTGAVIIKQTMEALGISMKSVLQEAQQVQESINNSSKECQASIMEYKKQIFVLEKQAQKYQKQYSALNDIISLFIQTNM